MTGRWRSENETRREFLLALAAATPFVPPSLRSLAVPGQGDGKGKGKGKGKGRLSPPGRSGPAEMPSVDGGQAPQVWSTPPPWTQKPPSDLRAPWQAPGKTEPESTSGGEPGGS